MDWLETPHERRRAMRVRSKGSIQIRHGARLIRARVADLALGGICAHAELPIGLRALIGELVRVGLRFDACPAIRFTLFGRVLRVNVAMKTVAIGFDTVPDEFEDCVQNELLAAVEHDSLPRVILVDSLVARRNTIADAFRNAGCHVTEAATPLEAIRRLGRARFAPGVIAIADTVPESVAEELRGFLLDEHPHAHMVAIGRSAANRDPSQTWLSSTDAHEDLQVRVGRVMTSHSSRRRSTISPAATNVWGLGREWNRAVRAGYRS